jgi:hypothetical protein
MPTSITSVAILLLYLAGLIAFVLFYGKEEGTARAYVGAFAAILIAFVLGVFYRITIIGAMVAATFMWQTERIGADFGRYLLCSSARLFYL